MRRAHYRKHGRTPNSNKLEAIAKRRDIMENPPLSAQLVGYARVSTSDQVLDVQLRALNEMGCDPIFAEQVSAVNLKRPEFHLMKKHVEPGDTIVFHSYSRISRKLKDLLEFVEEMKERSIRLVSITEPGINPFSSGGKLQLSIIGAADEHERTRVRDRTSMAMQDKIASGMYIGRPKLVDDEQVKQMKAQRRAGIPIASIATKFGISKSAVYSHTAK